MFSSFVLLKRVPRGSRFTDRRNREVESSDPLCKTSVRFSLPVGHAESSATNAEVITHFLETLLSAPNSDKGALMEVHACCWLGLTFHVFSRI